MIAIDTSNQNLYQELRGKIRIFKLLSRQHRALCHGCHTVTSGGDTIFKWGIRAEGPLPRTDGVR